MGLLYIGSIFVVSTGISSGFSFFFLFGAWENVGLTGERSDSPKFSFGTFFSFWEDGGILLR